jgi:molecular chaperone GrpE
LHQEHKNPEKKESEIASEQIAKLHSEIAELTATLKQVQADFENYKKRIEKSQDEFAKFAGAKIIADFLPVLDSFDSAISKMQNDSNFSRAKTIEGMLLLKKQIDDYLRVQGVEELNPAGKIFDPHYNEILSRGSDASKPENYVIEVFQKGYLMHGKLLRPARVRINKPGDEKMENLFGIIKGSDTHYGGVHQMHSASQTNVKQSNSNEPITITGVYSNTDPSLRIIIKQEPEGDKK